MAINKKLIHFKNKTDFQTQYNAGNLLNTSIVFIQDAKQIWTHGQFYSCPFTEEEIKQLFTGANIKLDNYSEIESPIDIKATDTVNEAFGKIEDYLDSLSDLNAILVDTGDVASDPIINDYISPSELSLTLTNYATKNQLNINDTGAKAYTDTVVKNLVNAAPETLDTLGELATAITNNQGIVDTLDAAITNKLDKTVASSTYATKTDLNNKITADGTVTAIVALTQAQYNALGSNVSPTTLYIITD